MNVVEIIFSPTGGTEKTADIIGRHLGETIVKIDLSDWEKDFSGYEIGREDMVLIAMPSDIKKNYPLKASPPAP